MPTGRTALLAGASGLVGRYVLDQLLGTPDYARVVALVRRPLEVEHPKLVEIVASFDALDQLPEPLRGDDAFCCLGTTMKRAGSREAFRAVDHGAVLAFAWAAQRGGAKRFFTVSAMGANAESRVFYNRVKGETEEALGVLGFEALGIFRPGLLRGPREEYRFGERLGVAVLALADPLLVGSWRRYRPVHAAVVARAMVRTSFGQARGVLTFGSDEIQDLGRAGGVG
ncbi:MAG: oxidoreductase [Opitutus sp.]|nr:oxidoreductase [Opitutus sp.]